MARQSLLVLALAAAPSLPARAHDVSGLHRLAPGMAFNLLSMKAVLPGGPSLGAVDFNALRGSALAFLVIDPFLPKDVAEAHRFERLARRLPHTRAFLVALPERSQRPTALLAVAVREKLELPLVIDDRDIFPYVFGFDLRRSPRYELFDRAGTLILENPARLSQRLATGLTIENALRELDAGRPVEPGRMSAREDLGTGEPIAPRR
ncbi:MAG: hypothetical protein ACYDCL_03880 [Myxococcales bacterium]